MEQPQPDQAKANPTAQPSEPLPPRLDLADLKSPRIAEETYHGRHGLQGNVEVWVEEFRATAQRPQEATTRRPLPLHLDGRHRIARLMEDAGLCGRQKGHYCVQTTDSNHDHPIAPNRLARDSAFRPLARLGARPGVPLGRAVGDRGGPGRSRGLAGRTFRVLGWQTWPDGASGGFWGVLASPSARAWRHPVFVRPAGRECRHEPPPRLLGPESGNHPAVNLAAGLPKPMLVAKWAPKRAPDG